MEQVALTLLSWLCLRIKPFGGVTTDYSLFPSLSAACPFLEQSAAEQLLAVTLIPMRCLCWWQFGRSGFLRL